MKSVLTSAILNNYTESIIRAQTPASPGKYLRRSTSKLRGGVVMDTDSLDSYYVRFINDALRLIRKGRTAYLFRLVQVRDVLKFEPTAHFAVHDGIISVNLNA